MRPSAHLHEGIEDDDVLVDGSGGRVGCSRSGAGIAGVGGGSITGEGTAYDATIGGGTTGLIQNRASMYSQAPIASRPESGELRTRRRRHLPNFADAHSERTSLRMLPRDCSTGGVCTAAKYKYLNY